MKRLQLPRSIVTGVILAFVAIGCSGGSGDPITPGPDHQAADVSITLGPGEEIDGFMVYPVMLENVTDISAISFRIGFHPEGLQPVGIEWGDMITGEDGTFHMLDRPDFLPIAFARMNGRLGINADGEFCRVRFRIRNRERIRAWLIDDPDFLVARDSLGNRLRMRVRGENR